MKNDTATARVAYGLAAAAIALFAVEMARVATGHSFYSYGISYLDYCLDETPGAFLRHVFEHTYYPPFYFAWTEGLCRLIGFDYRHVLALDAVFVPLGALYLTALALRLGLGRFAFLPGVLLVLFPGTAIASRTLPIEMPLLLFVPAAAFHLIASDGLRNRRHALAAGAWIGLAMLTKWAYPAYILGALLVAATAFLRDADGRFEKPSATQWKNVLLLAGVAAALAAWWYAFEMDWEVFAATTSNDPNRLEHRYRESVGFLLKAFGWIVFDPLHWGIAAAALAGLALSKRPGTVLAVAILGAVVPVLIFAIPVHTEMRYLYPAMPAAALVLGASVAFVRWSWARAALAVALIGFAGFNHFAFLEKPIERHLPAYHARCAELVTFLLNNLPAREEPMEVTVHPMWRNEHIHCEYLQYEARRQDADERLRITCTRGLDYARFHERLRGGRYDAVFTACGPDDDCVANDPETLDRTLAVLSKFGNIDQMSGEISKPFERADVIDDFDYLAAHYRLALYAPFADGTHTRVLFHERLLPKGASSD